MPLGITLSLWLERVTHDLLISCLTGAIVLD